MNDFSCDRVQQGGEFTAELAISSCIVWPGAWEGMRKNLPLILSHPLNKFMHHVSLKSGTSPLKGSIIIYTINEFKGVNIKLRNDSVADNIYVQQNAMSSHL